MPSPFAHPDLDLPSGRTDAPSPRVLVADDDPGSCRFLGDGLQQLGAHVLACGDGAMALGHARREAFDLLLLDCHMPGAGAMQILARLRADSTAASTASVAVATSAELQPRDRRQLLNAGFSEILLKPCTVADLRRMLNLVQADRPQTPILDDRAALTTSGDATTMRALRLLLREELALLLPELDRLLADRVGFGERLHRLRSSCGFCGATALAAHAAALQQQLARSTPAPAALARFRTALLSTLQALDR